MADNKLDITNMIERSYNILSNLWGFIRKSL